MNLKLILCAFFGIFGIFVQGNPVEVNKTQPECGKSPSGRGNVIGGRPSGLNAFPWLVALRLYSTNKFFCGGSLVSKKHVISAAHCFRDKRIKITTAPQEFVVWVGKHDLKEIDEEGSVAHSVNDLILHKDWDPEADDFDADIAIIVLEIEVDLKNKDKVRLVCLPTASNVEVTGNGTAVGWGISERSIADREYHDSKPNKLILPAVTREQCLSADPELDSISSNRTFCAGYVNQDKAVCEGDSGGGFYQYDSTKSAFSLVGIVSASLYSDGNGTCRNDIYSIFTDVTKFVEWIEKKMNERMEIKWTEVEFECKVRYGYFICKHNFNGSMTQNMKIRVSHANDASAERLRIDFQPSNHIFEGIGENFRNLKELWILNQQIKFVERKNFKNLKNLEELHLWDNQIEFLPEDVFSDLPNLTDLNLRENLIKTLPSKIFNNLRKLAWIWLDDNKIEKLPRDLFSENLKLKEVGTFGNPGKEFDIDFSRVPDVELWNETDYYYQRGEKFNSDGNKIE